MASRYYLTFDAANGTARFLGSDISRFAPVRTWEMAYPFASREEAGSVASDPRIPSPARIVTRDEAIARMAQDD